MFGGLLGGMFYQSTCVYYMSHILLIWEEVEPAVFFLKTLGPWLDDW